MSWRTVVIAKRCKLDLKMGYHAAGVRLLQAAYEHFRRVHYHGATAKESSGKGDRTDADRHGKTVFKNGVSDR